MLTDRGRTPGCRRRSGCLLRRPAARPSGELNEPAARKGHVYGEQSQIVDTPGVQTEIAVRPCPTVFYKLRDVIYVTEKKKGRKRVLTERVRRNRHKGKKTTTKKT